MKEAPQVESSEAEKMKKNVTAQFRKDFNIIEHRLNLGIVLTTLTGASGLYTGTKHVALGKQNHATFYIMMQMLPARQSHST